MPSSLRAHRSLLVIGVMAVLTTSCSQPDQPLRIGMNPWPGYEFLYLAEQLGYFEQEGVAIELVDLMSNGEVRRAFERGHIDIGTMTTPDLVTISTETDLEPTIFFVCDFSNGADVIIAKADTKDLPALSGKRVGADVHALDMVHLLGALKYHNMQSDDITTVPMKQFDMKLALDEGEIDAAVCYPPVSNTLLKQDGYHIIFDTSKVPGLIIDVLVTSRELANTRAEKLAAICRAFDRAVMYAESNPNDAYEIMGQHAQVDGPTMAANLDGLKVLRLSDQDELFQSGGSIGSSLALTVNMLELDPATVPLDRLHTAAITEQAQIAGGTKVP